MLSVVGQFIATKLSTDTNFESEICTLNTTKTPTLYDRVLAGRFILYVLKYF
jgi:hypothetical protein